MRILVAEDDAVLADGLQKSLRQAGYAVDLSRTGSEADAAVLHEVYDLIILDIGLPKLDGFEVLHRRRNRGIVVPVLILTARDAVEDRVKGLDLGADDYLTKPFALRELEARVRALLRRGQSASSAVITYGPLRYDSSSRQVMANDTPLELSARELTVLESLLLSTGKVVSKEQLVEKLCDWGEHVGTNAIEVYIHRLRKKLESFGVAIKTIRGLGYLMEKPRDL
ncbi:MAG: response regulator transcription factor [Burkholderiales bacterium]|nr:response regulator transcription factor [Burkholderiales bacterium]